MADIARFQSEHQSVVWHKNQANQRNNFLRNTGGSVFHASERSQPRQELEVNNNNKLQRNVRHCIRQETRPSYLRLDSTGEHSSGGSSGSEVETSPGCSMRCAPHFQQNPKQHFTSDRRNHQQQCSAGFFDRVKEVFSASTTNRHHGLAQRHFIPPDTRAEPTLVDLDSVAAKFTNMSCNMASRTPWNSSQQWERPAPQNHQSYRYSNFHRERNPPPFFHPYRNGNGQPNFISSTQNYRRTNYQPWNHNMARSERFFEPPYGGFENNFQHPVRWQHPPLFPQQPWFMPHVRMMHGPVNHNREPFHFHVPHQDWKRQHQAQQCHQSRKPRRRHRRGNQCGRQSQSDNKLQDTHHAPHARKDVDVASISVSKKDSPCGTDEHQSSEDSGVSSSDVSVTSEVHTLQVNQTVKHESAISAETLECNIAKKPQVEAVYVAEKECDSNDIKTVQPGKNDADALPTRHSSINLILGNYNVASTTKAQPSTDSDFSDADSDYDCPEDETADLWESFSSNDPYDPLRGWCHSPITSSPCCARQSSENHVDSGTDEGDALSDTDEEEESEDEGNASLDLSDITQTSPTLVIPQHQTASFNLESTPKQAASGSTCTSPIHPSVAFILGSTASSSDDDDQDDEDDDDWDTLEDSCNLRDDNLWNLFTKAKDPYSPMEAWKCRDSILSSAELTTKSAPSDSSRKHPHSSAISIEHQTATNPEGLPSSSSSEHKSTDPELTFKIPTVRFHICSKDDMDCPTATPKMENAGMRRTESSSCLRKTHLTPELRALKKVRFSVDSSFIVLVEKESPPCDGADEPDAPDWLTCARDRMRFQARITRAAIVLDPILDPVHRQQAYQSRSAPLS